MKHCQLNIKQSISAVILLIASLQMQAEDGYDLWLRYKIINDPKLLQSYRNSITGFNINTDSPTVLAAREELQNGLKGLLGKTIPSTTSLSNGVILASPASRSSIVRQLISSTQLDSAGKEGFIIRSVSYRGKKIIIICGNADIGILYGCFHFLRLLQTNQSIANLAVLSSPLLELRLLNHWDNLNRYVERGYAGISIWNWHTLPGYKDPRYKVYARANASIGINGVSLTNVNASAVVLTKPFFGEMCSTG